MKNKITEKEIQLFHCECECKSAINNIITKYNISTTDYTKVLIEIKEWINYITKNE